MKIVKNFIIVILVNYFMRIGNVLAFLGYLIATQGPRRQLLDEERLSMKEQLLNKIIVIIYNDKFCDLLNRENYHQLYLFSILLSLIGQALVECYFDYQRYKKSREINNTPATILERFTDFNYFAKQQSNEMPISIYKQVRTQDIQVGDIVFIRKNEVFPVDVIILDIQISYCSSNNSYCCGKTIQNKIYPIPITYIPRFSKIKGNHFDYKKILTGKIEYVSAKERNESKFEGFIKVSKDPVGTVVAKENICYRGSILEYSDWVIGVAIYTGKECYYYKDTTINPIWFKDKKPLSFFQLKKEKYFSLYFFLFIFCCLISVIRTHMNTCFNVPLVNSLGEPNVDDKSFYVGLSYFCDYMLFLPQIYYFFCDIIELLLAFFSNIEFNKQDLVVSQQNQSQADFPLKIDSNSCCLTNLITKLFTFLIKDSFFLRNSSKPIEDLSIVTDCFIDKTGTLTQGRSFDIDKLYMLDAEYIIGDNFIDPFKGRRILSQDLTNDPTCRTLLKKDSMREKKKSVKQMITLITHEVTDQQNDIVGEEGIFLRKDIPNVNSIKNKNEVETKNQDDFEIKNELDDLKVILENELNKQENLKPNNIEPIFNEKQLTKNQYPFSHQFDKQEIMKNQKYKTTNFDDQEFKLVKNMDESQELQDVKQGKAPSPEKQSQSYTSNINSSNDKKAKEQQKQQLIEFSKSLETEMVNLHRKQSIAREQVLQQLTEQRLYEEVQSYSSNFNSQKEAILAMCICHISKSFINKKTTALLTDHQTIYDNLFLSFARRFECKFRCVSRTTSDIMEYITTLGKKTYVHQIHIPPVYNERGNRLQLLVSYDEHYYVYVREEITTLPSYIKNFKTLKDKFQSQLQNMTENGQIGILFCRKQISAFQAQTMVEKYQEVRKIIDYSQSYKQTEMIYRENISDMEVISMVSIREKLNSNAEKLVCNLKLANIHIWMVTGDDYIRAVTAAFQSKIIDASEKNEIIHFNQLKEEEIGFQIQHSLSKLKEILEDDPKRNTRQSINNQFNSQKFLQPDKFNCIQAKQRQMYIVINGECLTKIMENQSHRDHFLFLSFFCDAFIGYQLSPFQKAQLIQIKKKCNKDFIYTLAIGDGLNDIQMMREADYSIQIINNKIQSVHDFHGLSEIGVRQISDINKILFEKSRICSKNYEHMLVFIFYRQSFIFASVFFWNFMQCSLGDMIYNSYELILLNAICFFVDFIQIYFKDDPYDKKEIFKQVIKMERFQKINNTMNISINSIENSHRFLQNQKIEDASLLSISKAIVMSDVLKNFFLNILPQAIISAMILFCVPYYSLGLGATTDGVIVERTDVIYTYILLFVLLLQIHLNILCEHSLKSSLKQILWFIIFSIVYLLINYQNVFWESFLSINLILQACVVIFLYTMYSILFKIFYPLLKISLNQNYFALTAEKESFDKETQDLTNADQSEQFRDTVEQVSQASPDKIYGEQNMSNFIKNGDDQNYASPRMSLYSSPLQVRKKKLQAEQFKIPTQFNSRRNSIEQNSTANFFRLHRAENNNVLPQFGNNISHANSLQQNSFQINSSNSNSNSPKNDNFFNNFGDQKGDSINEYGNNQDGSLKYENSTQNNTEVRINPNDISQQNSLNYNVKRNSSTYAGEIEKNLLNLQDFQNISILQKRKMTDDRPRQVNENLTSSKRQTSSTKNIVLNKIDPKKITFQNEDYSRNKMHIKRLSEDFQSLEFYQKLQAQKSSNNQSVNQIIQTNIINNVNSNITYNLNNSINSNNINNNIIYNINSNNSSINNNLNRNINNIIYSNINSNINSNLNLNINNNISNNITYNFPNPNDISSQADKLSYYSHNIPNMLNSASKKSKYMTKQPSKLKNKQRNALRQAIQNKRFFQGYEIYDIIRMVFEGREADRIVLEINPKNYNDVSFKIQNMFFRFNQINIEKQFMRLMSLEFRFFSQVSSLLLSLMCEFALAILMNMVDYEFGFNTMAVAFGIHFLIWGLMLTPQYLKRFFLINTIQLIVRIVSRLILIFDDSNFNVNILQSLFYSSIIQYSVVINPPLQLTSQLLLSIIQCLILSFRYNSDIGQSKGSSLKYYINIQIYCFVISFSLFIFLQNCIYQILLRKNFERINKLQNESKKMNDVLAILLPKFIRDSINEKGIAYQEDQGEVAILFCDICDFDAIIESEKKNIIKLLDRLFRMYDESCKNYGLQKIETVGKTYMAAADYKNNSFNFPFLTQESTLLFFSTIQGEFQNQYLSIMCLKGLPPLKKYLNNSELINPVTICVLMAHDMYENAKKIQYGNKLTRLQVKIGIHYGSVMAGVIGGHKPQFSLIGDTVNMASRVCSTGAADAITISSQANQKCSKQLQYLNKNSGLFNLRYKTQLIEKTVEAKGKGLIQTFQIVFLKDKKRHMSRFYNVEYDKTSTSSNAQIQQIPSNNLESSVQFLGMSTQLPNIPQNTLNANNDQQQQMKSGYNIQAQVTTVKSQIGIEKIQSTTQVSYVAFEPQPPIKKGKYQTSINKNELTLKKNASSVNIGHQLQVYSQHLSPIPERVNQDPTEQAISMSDALLKVLGNDIGVVPNIEYQNELKDEIIDLDRIQENFSEIQNELSQIQSNDKSITKQISFIDLLKGKYNNEFQIFQMETILNDSSDIKQKGYFLLAFEIFKMVIVNLMSEFIGSRGSLISFVIHIVSTVLLISIIFGYNRISRIGVSAVKLIMFLIYFFTIGAIVFEAYSFVSQQDNTFFNQTQTAAVIIVFSSFLSLKIFSIQEKIFISFILILSFLLFTFNNKIARLEYCYITISIILTQLYNSFQHLELSITSFQNRKKLDVKINEQNKLLQYLLPSHIRDRFLKNQAKTINLIDNFDNVTVLFADIAGFTKYSASVRPEQVVFMLRELFTKFDQKCQENNVFKLYTIGDCYVVMGLVNVENRDYAKEAMNVIELGFCMIDIIQQVRAVVNFDELEMRIGIHTGSIIGGVVGTGVVRYDIYGPDVVIANKMESNGESGRIMISETTYNLILDQCAGIYEFEQEKQVNIPAYKRTVKSYLVKKVCKSDSNTSLQHLKNIFFKND